MANRWETVETVVDFILGGSKITADGDCSHEIKRRLLLGRKAMTNLAAKLLSHFSRVRLCATPQTAAHQALLSLGFSRQEYWSGLPFPSGGKKKYGIFVFWERVCGNPISVRYFYEKIFKFLQIHHLSI